MLERTKEKKCTSFSSVSSHSTMDINGALLHECVSEIALMKVCQIRPINGESLTSEAYKLSKHRLH